MKETAVLLIDNTESDIADHISKVLRFFGVAYRVSTLSQLFVAGQPSKDSSTKMRVFCSSDALCRLIEELEHNPEATRAWVDQVHSVFVYAGSDAAMLKKAARRLMIAEHTSLIGIAPGFDQWVVSDKEPCCGAMSGLRIPIRGKTVAFDESNSVFLRANHQTVPVFLSAAREIINIDAEIVQGNFDIRDHFLSATPMVMYVQWAFADTCWSTPEINACVIIDDPLLTPQYGFLNYQNLLTLMERHNFTTNIAFIPWNWRRSDSAVVDMFKSHPQRYSLSIHGCDHTGGEFGIQNVERLVWKSRQAIDRMSHHEAQTGIHHDRIMVFPQGVFSQTSLGVLKRAHFSAAVNTEVLSTDPNRLPIKISDVWDVAVMKYGYFPVFTRRYPSQGIENFAFDSLLGKPCIVVVHHDYCRNQSAHLIEFINRLNASNCRLSWRSLGDVVSRSYRQRSLSASLVEAEMYGSELRVKNRSEQQRHFRITRRESEASAVKEVHVGSRKIPWNYSEGRICFEIDLAASESTTVSVTFYHYPGTVCCQENMGYKLKTMLRRYLSEFRDNYVVTRRT